MNFRRAVIIIVLLAILLSSLGIASAQERTHTVKPGETLGSIARLYGLTIEQIAAANGIANPNLIYAGQVLIIPGGSSGGTGATTTYVVVAGDTLSKIAQRFGTTVTTLAQLNGLTNPDVLFIGQVLLIPSQGGQTPATTAAPAPTLTPQPTGQGGPVETITYVVRPGDTLSQIALRFGTTYQQIVLLNNLSNPDLIYPGQVLTIRQGSATPKPPTATATATATATPTAVPSPTSTPTPTLTLVPGVTASPSETPTPTETPELTATYPPGFNTPTPFAPSATVPPNAPNLLTNPGFEGQAQSVGFDDVLVLNGWQPFYCDQPYTAEKCPALRLGSGNPVNLLMGRPAFQPTNEAGKVNSGTTAQQWSCTWRACRGGVYQTVQTTPGALCEAGAFVQSWSTDDVLSFASDLVTRDDRDNSTWFIIVDPTGGTNAYANGLLVSRGFGYDDGIYDQYVPISYLFTATGSQVTVFFENLRLWPITNNVNYIDDAYLRCAP